MTPEHVKQVVAAHARSLGVHSRQDRERVNPGHLVWMCHEIPKFLDAGKVEKAMRWLGFVQGVMVARKLLTIEEAKKLNAPPEPPKFSCAECEDTGQIGLEQQDWVHCTCEAGQRKKAEWETDHEKGDQP